MPHEPSGDHELAELFRDFAATTGSRAPLYADISEAIASDPRSHIRELLDEPINARHVSLTYCATSTISAESSAKTSLLSSAHATHKQTTFLARQFSGWR